MWTLESHNKVYLVPQNGGYATNLQAKILKKLSDHQIYQSKQKNSQKKTVFRTLKVERSQKFVWGLPDGICRLHPKS
jgi:hypothetical protein